MTIFGSWRSCLKAAVATELKMDEHLMPKRWHLRQAREVELLRNTRRRAVLQSLVFFRCDEACHAFLINKFQREQKSKFRLIACELLWVGSLADFNPGQIRVTLGGGLQGQFSLTREGKGPTNLRKWGKESEETKEVVRQGT